MRSRSAAKSAKIWSPSKSNSKSSSTLINDQLIDAVRCRHGFIISRLYVDWLQPGRSAVLFTYYIHDQSQPYYYYLSQCPHVITLHPLSQLSLHVRVTTAVSAFPLRYRSVQSCRIDIIHAFSQRRWPVPVIFSTYRLSASSKITHEVCQRP